MVSPKPPANVFLQLAVYRSALGSGDAARDFAAEWDELVAKRYRVIGDLSTETADHGGGCGSRPWAVRPSTPRAHRASCPCWEAVFSGHGIKVSVLINFNDQRFQPNVDRFLDSIRLREPPPQTAPRRLSPPCQQPPAAAPSLVGREWYKSVANYSNWGYNPSGMEIAKIGNQGYTRWSYVFHPDGTYAFNREFVHEQAPRILVPRGDGRLPRRRRHPTVTPRTARRILRNKAYQQQGDAVPAELELGLPTASSSTISRGWASGTWCSRRRQASLVNVTACEQQPVPAVVLLGPRPARADSPDRILITIGRPSANGWPSAVFLTGF